MPFTRLNDFFRGIKPRLLDGAAGGALLRVTFIAGLFLFFLTGGAFIFFSIMGRGSAPRVSESNFYTALREYDRQFNAAGGADDLEKFARGLDRIEKRAGGVDSLLSVLKRRRALAETAPAYFASYRDAARRASVAYPHSDTLAALAAAALVKDSGITAETADALKRHLANLSQPRMENTRLALRVLLGDMQTPEKAAASGGDFPAASLPAEFTGREDIIINAALLKLIAGKPPLGEMQNLLAEYRNGGGARVSENTLNFAAEVFYDFGDPLRAAELFSRGTGDYAVARQADALWLADYPESARNIWNVLADSPDDNYRARALYNLALSAANDSEAIPLYEKLAALPKTEKNSCREFGIIYYSRRFDAARAAALLETAAYTADRANPLVELELLRRRTETGERGRSIGEVWLLVDRYPDEENVYRWGAWYFGLQRAFTETAMLLKNAARRQFTGQWMRLHEALLAISEGDLDNAEKLLLELNAGEKSGWEAAANLGRIYEASRAPARALEYYEKAAAAVQNKADASRVQVRAARCFTALGRPRESQRALEYALDLNPDNVNARLELSRLNMR